MWARIWNKLRVVVKKQEKFKKVKWVAEDEWTKAYFIARDESKAGMSNFLLS